MHNLLKEKKIKKLREKIKKCPLCINESGKTLYNIIAEDSDRSPKTVNYWSDWGKDGFPNYDADIMIAGQDWGPVNYLEEFLALNNGKIPFPYSEDNNPTWGNLMHFLENAGINLESVYLTNALLCLRQGEMSGNQTIDDKWFDYCFKYLKEHIEIIQPNIIVTLGERVFRLFAKEYKIPYKKFSNVVAKGYHLSEDMSLFPLYHTGGLGERNRKVAKKAGLVEGETIDDFKKLKTFIDEVMMNEFINSIHYQ